MRVVKGTVTSTVSPGDSGWTPSTAEWALGFFERIRFMKLV